MPVRNVVPWLLAASALPFAALLLDFSAPTACDALPSAFSRGVKTEYSDTLWVVASYGETTSIVDGSRESTTVVNWAGLLASGSLLIGAWILGAGLAELVDRRRALCVFGAAAAAGLVALVVFFI